MSIQAMSWAMTQQIEKRATERHVLMCLANYADQDGKAAFPSVSTLSKDTGLSERTVQLKLSALLESGLIVKGNQKIVAAYIDREDRRPVCYDLVIERGESDGKTGRTSRQNGVNMEAERGEGDSPNTYNKPLSKPSKNQVVFSRIRSGEFGDVFTHVSDDNLKAWIAHKKEPTEKMITGMAKQLSLCLQAGYKPDDAVNEQLENGWSGFKAEWVLKNLNQNRPNMSYAGSKPSPYDDSSDFRDLLDDML